MMRVRSTVLGDPGNLEAPPGTEPWATAMRLRIQNKLKERDDAEESLESARDAFIKHEGWRQLRDRRGRRFATWEQFCSAPKPFGLGTTAETIEAEVQERNRGGQPGNRNAAKDKPKNEVDNVNFVSKGGNSAIYLCQRLKRKKQFRLLARVQSGELTAHAAARLAGIVKTKTHVEQLLKLWDRTSTIDRREFLRLIRADDSEDSDRDLDPSRLSV